MRPVDRKEPDAERDERLPDDLRPRRETERALLHDLRVVVDEPEQTAAEQRDQRDHAVAADLAEAQVDDRDHEQYQHAAHRGRALLDEVPLGAVRAHLLPDVPEAKQPDPQREEHTRKHAAPAPPPARIW